MFFWPSFTIILRSSFAYDCLSFILDYVFANGCRSPPWRQVHGDIAYIEVKTKEGERFPLTASTSGYYVNRGMKKDGEIDYDRESDIFPSLVHILKAKSSFFAEAINKKVSRIYQELRFYQYFVTIVNSL